MQDLLLTHNLTLWNSFTFQGINFCLFLKEEISGIITPSPPTTHIPAKHLLVTIYSKHEDQSRSNEHPMCFFLYILIISVVLICVENLKGKDN